MTELSEYHGHTVTARTHDEPYFMWRRVSTCLPQYALPPAMLRVDNTEHTQPIPMFNKAAGPNGGINAKDIEVCLWLLFNVFRVNAYL